MGEFGGVPKSSGNGGGVPISILRSSRLRGLEAGGWELRRLGSSLEVQKFRRGVSSLEVQKFRRGVKHNWSLQPLKKRGGGYPYNIYIYTYITACRNTTKWVGPRPRTRADCRGGRQGLAHI